MFNVAIMQVIDTGLALAKPRECKDDTGAQVPDLSSSSSGFIHPQPLYLPFNRSFLAMPSSRG